MQASKELGISHGQLSRIERGEQPYSQEILEGLAALFDCNVIDLLCRSPADDDLIWTIWDQAGPEERKQIASVAKALLKGWRN